MVFELYLSMSVKMKPSASSSVCTDLQENRQKQQCSAPAQMKQRPPARQPAGGCGNTLQMTAGLSQSQEVQSQLHFLQELQPPAVQQDRKAVSN